MTGTWMDTYVNQTANATPPKPGEGQLNGLLDGGLAQAVRAAPAVGAPSVKIEPGELRAIADELDAFGGQLMEPSGHQIDPNSFGKDLTSEGAKKVYSQIAGKYGSGDDDPGSYGSNRYQVGLRVKELARKIRESANTTSGTDQALSGNFGA